MCGSTVRVPRSQPPAYGSSKTSWRCISGPRNMMIERVRRAASSSMRSRSRSAGGTISRSLSSLSQRVCTPMLASTSRSRLTSSMRATRRSVVRPRLSRRGAEQRDAGVLRGLHVDGAGQRRRAGDPQVRRARRRARRSRSRAPRRCGRASPGRGSGGRARSGSRRSGWWPARRRAAAGSSRGACGRRGSGCRSGRGSRRSCRGLYLTCEIHKTTDTACRERTCTSPPPRACHGQRGSRVPGFD